MQIRRFLARHILRRIEDWVKGQHVLSHLALLEQSQSWPREKLDSYRLDQLVRLLTHAYAHVPFYQERLDAVHITPSDIKSLDDLSCIPILSRDDLRQNCEANLRSSIHDFSRCYKGSSSGSTGDPVAYYKDQHSLSTGWASALAGRGLGGRQLGDTSLTLWGNYVTVQHEWKRLDSRLKAWLYGDTRIAAFELRTDEAIKQALSCVMESNAQFLHGYTNAIYVLALAAQERGFKRNVPFQGVTTTAETLMPKARYAIEDVFGPVFDGYGCGEVTGVAYQCREREGYHIVEPDVIVEYEDIGLGDEKAILLTDLSNYAMPLIRYRVGDIAVPDDGRCQCGCTWGLLKAIRGRTNDIITTSKGGRLLVPSVFGSTLLKDVSGIAQYQLALVADGKVVVRVVPTSQFDAQGLEAIQRSLEPYLSGVIEYSIQVVDRIPPAPTGKFKLVVDEGTSVK